MDCIPSKRKVIPDDPSWACYDGGIGPVESKSTNQSCTAYRGIRTPRDRSRDGTALDDDEDRRSLLELAAYFNRAVLEAALEEEAVQVLDGEIKNIYRLLTDDNVGVPTERGPGGGLSVRAWTSMG